MKIFYLFYKHNNKKTELIDRFLYKNEAFILETNNKNNCKILLIMLLFLCDRNS